MTQTGSIDSSIGISSGQLSVRGAGPAVLVLGGVTGTASSRQIDDLEVAMAEITEDDARSLAAKLDSLDLSAAEQELLRVVLTKAVEAAGDDVTGFMIPASATGGGMVLSIIDVCRIPLVSEPDPAPAPRVAGTTDSRVAKKERSS